MTPEQTADKMQAASKALSDTTNLRRKLGLLVEGAGKKRAHVRTGTLRRSIASELFGTDEVRVGSPLQYAPFQPNDFLMEGLEDVQTQIDGLMQDHAEATMQVITG